ncbi:beta-lactamase family protein [bacterium]|nr:beta-lactamase family protein [bacterium]
MKKRLVPILILIALAIFSVSCGNSKNNDVPDADTPSDDEAPDQDDTEPQPDDDTDPALEKKVESIRNLAEEYIGYSHGTGIVIGFGVDELTSIAYGIRDSRTQEPLSTDDLFEIGSITKNFTAVTMLLLQEAGKVDLDQTIDEWFPDFEKSGKITVRMLLNHTSGIQEPSRYGDPEKVLEEVNGKFNFEPGTDWAYSNTNFILAGLIINEVTGEEAHEVIREKILEPLGMTHTFMKNAEEYPLEDKARGHTFDEYGNIIQYELNEYFWTAGGILSNVEDMFKYAHALFNGELLSEESMEQMFDMVKVSGIPVYGLGIMYGSGPHGSFYNHGGDVITSAAQMIYYPETREIHILFDNFSGNSSTLGILNDEIEFVLMDDKTAEKATGLPNWEELIDNEDDTQIFALYAPLPDYPAEELDYSVGYFVYPEDYYPDFYCVHYMFKSQNAYVKIIQECSEPLRYYEGILTLKVMRTDIDMYLRDFEAAAESGEPVHNFYITKYDYFYDVESDSVSKICYALEDKDPNKYMVVSSGAHPSDREFFRVWGRSKMAESERESGCHCYDKSGEERECSGNDMTEEESIVPNLPTLL